MLLDAAFRGTQLSVRPRTTEPRFQTLRCRSDEAGQSSCRLQSLFRDPRSQILDLRSEISILRCNEVMYTVVPRLTCQATKISKRSCCSSQPRKAADCARLLRHDRRAHYIDCTYLPKAARQSRLLVTVRKIIPPLIPLDPCRLLQVSPSSERTTCRPLSPTSARLETQLSVAC